MFILKIYANRFVLILIDLKCCQCFEQNVNKFLSKYRSEDESGHEDRAEHHPGLSHRHSLRDENEEEIHPEL